MLCTLPARGVRAVSGTFSFSGALVAQNCSKSPRARPGPLRAAQSRSDSRSGRAQGRSEPLRAAQNRSERAQSRSESPRAVAQSCSRNCSGSPRARPELVRAAQGRPERAQSCSEPLRIAWSVLRAAQSRSESPRAVAQSCSKNRSGSSVSRALCISDAQFYLTWFSLLRACICTGSH